jgi:hypothetical protein
MSREFDYLKSEAYKLEKHCRWETALATWEECRHEADGAVQCWEVDQAVQRCEEAIARRYEVLGCGEKV